MVGRAKLRTEGTLIGPPFTVTMSDHLSPEQRDRYARHLVLPGVGSEGQKKLLKSSVLVVGAGGLGSPALMYLAAAGVGRIGIVDNDKVSSSNLQRQIIHSTSSIGSAKVKSASNWISKLNPDIEIEEIEMKLTSENSIQIISQYDVVIDGTDNFESRYLIGDSCEVAGKPWIFGSIHRFEGQVSSFNLDGGPNYRDLFPSPPPPELAPNCSEAGVLGILPGIVGTIQATEAIKIILGVGNCLSGELLVIDVLTMDFRKLEFSMDAGREKVTSLSKKEEKGFFEIGAKELSQRRNEGWTPFLLDVRRSDEEQISSIRGTDSRIMHLEIPSRLEELPLQGDIVVYCRSGQRSDAVARFIVDSGLFNGTIYNLLGGINAWADEVDPTLAKY
ncbi:MAG: molybdopterin-synthase adenylyltransferase MoeB [Candidatus Thermoplasmatota archaeon]|nr:molybdopterin-synthase adenylyltransferase MoeB [Candidatus Thermoplasmatota archaeon]